MSFFLDHPNRSIASIRLEIYLSNERSRFKYNTGRSIKPEHWNKKTRRAKTMRGAQGDRNRKLNLDVVSSSCGRLYRFLLKFRTRN
ncbi:MAG: Arm DNA-binding domain-containing protein [Flavobacteriaceae bacterium]